MKRKIFPNDFVPYYPIGIQPCTMYVDVANRIYERIKDMDIALPYADELKKEIAVNVAIYYEDKMSGIGLWNAFVSRHKIAYLRPLPFFDDYDDLADDDVNAQDVELLVWLVISRNFYDQFLNPLTMGTNAANLIMQVLTEDEEVEVNDGLYDFIYGADKANDYFKLKHVLIWLRRSYLLYSPLSDEKFEYLRDKYSDLCNKSESTYFAETELSMTTEIGPMALPPHLWLSEMYKNNGMAEEADRLKNLKYCYQDAFEVVKTDADFTILKDTKGEEYKLKNQHPDIFCASQYVATALVKYGDNDWEMNGEMFETRKKNYDTRCERNLELKISYEHTYPMYMERTNGKRLFFFENSNQLKEWLKTVSPEVDTEQIVNRLPSGAFVAFISKKAGIIFAPNITHAIKCKDNPFYRKCNANKMQTETMNAVLNMDMVHPELLHYLLDNKMLQDGNISSMAPNEAGNKIFTLNIDFIARNHRRHHYHDHDF